jgi:hypothetical protein
MISKIESSKMRRESVLLAPEFVLNQVLGNIVMAWNTMDLTQLV